MNWRQIGLMAMLAFASPSGAMAQSGKAPSDQIPDLRFVPNGTDVQKFPRNFFAHKRGVSFAVALEDLGACDRISAVTQSPFAGGVDFVPFGPTTTVRPEVERRGIPGGGLLVALGDSLVSRNIRLANLRECLMYKGYTLYGVTSKAWEAIEAGGPEAALRIRAKLASGSDPVQPVAFAPAAAYPAVPSATAMPPQTVHLRKPDRFKFDPTKAHILVRTKVPKGAFPYDLVFVRELTQVERDGYDTARNEAFAKAKNPGQFTFTHEAPPNLAGTYYPLRDADSGDERHFFSSVTPGTYLIAGTRPPGGATNCFCMGSVKFEAKAGEITDLGYLFSSRIDRPSTIPELIPLVSRPKLRSHAIFLMASAIRPYSSDMPIVEELKQFRHVAPEFRPVGVLPNLFGLGISRLAPLPGVLAYDGRRVLDARTGQELPAN